MTTIYIVTDGSYSDKRNVAVFSKLEDAERYRDRINDTRWGDAGIEDFELDAIPESFLSGKRQAWKVYFKEYSADIEKMELLRYFPDITEDEQGYMSRQGWFAVNVWAESQEAAAKIAMERRAVWLANH